jgi:DNA-binding response OmpR family regulator
LLAGATPPESAKDAQSAAAARLWLADDSAGEAEHLRNLLSRAAYRVETFADGESLLERLAQPGVETPELLLLDWIMPGLSGLELCRFLRERYGPTDLPILVLAASTHEAALEEAFAAGANDYVTKPARAVELLARLRTLLQTRRDAEALRARERDRACLLVEAEAERTRLTTILSALVVRAHGGSVEVASTVEADTTFIVRLPRAR